MVFCMAHTYSQLYYHLVWSTKERLALIEDDFKDGLYAYISGAIKFKGGVLIAIGGMPDHVHLCVSLPPSVCIADAVRNVKISSNKWVAENVGKPRLGQFAWQEGYGAFSISRSGLDEVNNYIHNQAEHHKRWSFRDEFLCLLRRYEIEFDEQYLWK